VLFLISFLKTASLFSDIDASQHEGIFFCERSDPRNIRSSK
jgi:hypothetical protein